MIKLDQCEQEDELFFYIGTIIRLLFVFEPIDYDLERMLLMAPHPSEQKKIPLKGADWDTDGSSHDTDKWFDDAKEDAKDDLDKGTNASDRSKDPKKEGDEVDPSS